MKQRSSSAEQQAVAQAGVARCGQPQALTEAAAWASGLIQTFLSMDLLVATPPSYSLLFFFVSASHSFSWNSIDLLIPTIVCIDLLVSFY